MFNFYCAPCHGKDAKGNGPAQQAFEKRGVWRSWFIGPADRGALFSSASGRDDSIVQMRIANLIHDLDLLQEK